MNDEIAQKLKAKGHSNVQLGVKRVLGSIVDKVRGRTEFWKRQDVKTAAIKDIDRYAKSWSVDMNRDAPNEDWFTRIHVDDQGEMKRRWDKFLKDLLRAFDEMKSGVRSGQPPKRGYNKAQRLISEYTDDWSMDLQPEYIFDDELEAILYTIGMNIHNYDDTVTLGIRD